MTEPIRFGPLEDELDPTHLDTLVTSALERIRADQTLPGSLARLWRVSLLVAALATIGVPMTSGPPPEERSATPLLPASALLDPALVGVAVGIDDAFVLLRPVAQ